MFRLHLATISFLAGFVLVTDCPNQVIAQDNKAEVAKDSQDDNGLGKKFDMRRVILHNPADANEKVAEEAERFLARAVPRFQPGLTRSANRNDAILRLTFDQNDTPAADSSEGFRAKLVQDLLQRIKDLNTENKALRKTTEEMSPALATSRRATAAARDGEEETATEQEQDPTDPIGLLEALYDRIDQLEKEKKALEGGGTIEGGVGYFALTAARRANDKYWLLHLNTEAKNGRINRLHPSSLRAKWYDEDNKRKLFQNVLGIDQGTNQAEKSDGLFRMIYRKPEAKELKQMLGLEVKGDATVEDDDGNMVLKPFSGKLLKVASANIVLNPKDEIRISDIRWISPLPEREKEEILSIMRKRRDPNSRSIRIDLPAPDNSTGASAMKKAPKNICVEYSQSMPRWSIQYRLNLFDKTDGNEFTSRLEAWARIYNRTAYDWCKTPVFLTSHDESRTYDLGEVTLGSQQFGLFRVVQIYDSTGDLGQDPWCGTDPKTKPPGKAVRFPLNVSANRFLYFDATSGLGGNPSEVIELKNELGAYLRQGLVDIYHENNLVGSAEFSTNEFPVVVRPASAVTINPGDHVVWSNLRGTHGVVFKSKEQAEKTLCFDTEATLPARGPQGDFWGTDALTVAQGVDPKPLAKAQIRWSIRPPADAKENAELYFQCTNHKSKMRGKLVVPKASRIQIDANAYRQWTVNDTATSSVPVRPGDVITWRVSGGNHGVTFADENTAKAVLEFDEKINGEKLPTLGKRDGRWGTAGFVVQYGEEPQVLARAIVRTDVEPETTLEFQCAIHKEKMQAAIATPKTKTIEIDGTPAIQWVIRTDNTAKIALVTVDSDSTVEIGSPAVEQKKPLKATRLDVNILTFLKGRTTTYKVQNKDRFSRNLRLKHPDGRAGGWNISGNASNVFSVTLEPGTASKVEVIEENAKEADEYDLRAAEPSASDLEKLVGAPPTVKAVLDAVIEKKTKIEEQAKRIEVLEKQRESLKAIQRQYIVDQSSPLNSELLSSTTKKLRLVHQTIRAESLTKSIYESDLDAELFNVRSSQNRSIANRSKHVQKNPAGSETNPGVFTQPVPRAGGVVYALHNQRCWILLGKETLEKRKKKWANFVGEIDNGESPMAAAIDEVHEETGFDRPYIERLISGKPPFVEINDPTYKLWAIKVDYQDPQQLQELEKKSDGNKSEMKWITLHELEKSLKLNGFPLPQSTFDEDQSIFHESAEDFLRDQKSLIEFLRAKETQFLKGSKNR